jgi:hypothetical protein
MASTKLSASTHPSPRTNATRRPPMARDETKDEQESQPLATNSEALWAFVGVLTLTLIMHLWEYH